MILIQKLLAPLSVRNIQREVECWESRPKFFLKCDSKCKNVFFLRNYCRGVTCNVCQSKFAVKIRRSLSGFFDNYVNDIFFMTLTFKNCEFLDKDVIKKYKLQLRRFVNDFCRKGRKDFQDIKGLINKGFYVFEFKDNGTHWNPHVHILYDGFGIEKSRLSEVWNICTKGEAYIVDIRSSVYVKGKRYYLADNPVKGVDYCTKYLSKVPYFGSDDRKNDYVNALKGLRRFNVMQENNYYRNLKIKKMSERFNWVFSDNVIKDKLPKYNDFLCPVCKGNKWLDNSDFKEEPLSRDEEKNAIDIVDGEFLSKVKNRWILRTTVMSLTSNVDKLEFNKVYFYEDLIRLRFNDKLIQLMLDKHEICHLKGGFGRI